MPAFDATGGILVRLQTESRIPVSTWKHWCSQLELSETEVVSVWDEVGRPLLVTTRQTPNLAFILRLRSLCLDRDILTFRDQAAVVLGCLELLDALEDESLSGATGRRAMLRLYAGRLACGSEGVGDSSAFVAVFCAAVLVTKVMVRQNVTLSGVVKVLVERQLTELIQLGMRSARSAPWAARVRSCLERCLILAEGADASSAESGDGTSAADVDGAPSVSACLAAFREALAAVYAASPGGATGSGPEEELAQRRETALGSFEPTSAHIPSMEEALAVQQQPPVASDSARQQALTKARIASALQVRSGRSGSQPSGGAATGGTGGATRSTAAAAGQRPGGAATGKSTGKSAGAGSQPSGAVPTGGGIRVSGRSAAEMSAAGGSGASGDATAVSPANARSASLNEIATQLGEQLDQLQRSGSTVWGVLVDPTCEIPDLSGFAREMTTDEAAERQAFIALEGVARWVSVKPLLTQAQQKDRRLMPRSLDRDIDAYVKFVGRKSVEPDSRVLMPLPRILDHAVIALVRVRALEDCMDLAESDVPVTPELVAENCAAAVDAVVRRVDERDLLARVWEQVLSDAQLLLDRHCSEKRVETCLAYARKLDGGGHLASLEKLEAALQAEPLELTADAADDAPAADVPHRLQQSAGLGEIVDQLRQHLFTALARALPPADDSTRFYDQLDRALRQALSRHIALRPRRERHSRNPRVALAVASLEQLTGHHALSGLFVRLNADGQVHFIADFRGGGYVDLFELRKNTSGQMHARARDKAAAERAAELQPGVSYLYSVGRTNAPFGRTPAEVMAGCVRDDEGRPQIFPMF